MISRSHDVGAALALSAMRVDICQVCGCTGHLPCLLENGEACSWLDPAHSLCSNPRCVARIPLTELELLVANNIVAEGLIAEALLNGRR